MQPRAQRRKVCITFAGVVGSSKTPIAVYLSGMLDLAVHNNDAIRTEVVEDLGSFNEDKYLTRRDARVDAILEKGIPFILDASVDRQWLQLKERLVKHDYRWFIISLDLSKDLLTRLHQAKGYTESLSRLDQLMEDHARFLETYSADIGLHISDGDFAERLQVSYDKTGGWIRDL